MYSADSIAMLETDEPGLGSRGVDTLTMSVTGNAIAQARHRVRRVNTSRLVFYDPHQREKVSFRLAVKESLQDVGIQYFPVFRNVHVRVHVSFFVRNLNKDLDNMIKFVLDALQSVVYRNDLCVVEMHSAKFLTAEPHDTTHIVVSSNLLRN